MISDELGRGGQKRNVGEARERGRGRRRENEMRTKRKKKGGEWEERTALFDINRHII